MNEEPMDVLPADPTVPGYYLRADYYDLLADLRRDAPVHEFAPGMRTIARYEELAGRPGKPHKRPQCTVMPRTARP